MERVLYMFVENFSNDTRESFFEKELPYLSEVFEKVYIMPLYPDNSNLNFSGDNVEVVNFNFFQPCNRLQVLFGNLSIVLTIFLIELFKTHNKKFYIKNFKTNLNNLLYKISAANNLEKVLKNDLNENTVFYSYWFMQWVLALSILKLRFSQIKIISRVHGADYDESQIKSTLPFRYFQLTKVDKVFPVSLFAKEYLQEKFKVSPDKIEVARLGLLLDERFAPIDDKQLHIVSCSSVIPLKRVELFIQILQHIEIPVKWTHFGDGPLLNNVKEKSAGLRTHISCDFKGYVSNPQFLEYLRNNSVSVFMNVSESEGIPVTLMEAISFGIPVIGPDICGVPEIVTQQTGFLIPKMFDSREVASVIEGAHKTGKLYSNEFRKNVYGFYKENFSAPFNYKKFSNSIVTI